MPRGRVGGCDSLSLVSKQMLPLQPAATETGQINRRSLQGAENKLPEASEPGLLWVQAPNQ